MGAHVLELLVDVLGELSDLLLHQSQRLVFGAGGLDLVDLGGGPFQEPDEENREKDQGGSDQDDEHVHIHLE